MSRNWKRGILYVIVVSIIVFIMTTIGPTFIGIALSVIIFVGITFLDYWIFRVIRTVQDKKQKYVICPRCNIPVEKEKGICPQCNNKV